MNRDAIRKRINLLRERTTARGCTEAEVMEAAARVVELMREHSLSGDDLDMGEEIGTVRASDKRFRDRLWAMVAVCTNTRALSRNLLSSLQLVYVGRDPDPEIAVYLLDVCNNAIDVELKRFRHGDFYRGRRKASTRRKASADFTVALVECLCRKLHDLFGDQIDDVRSAKAAAELDRRFPRTAANRPARRHKMRFDAAAFEGHRAGERVHIGRGVRGETDTPAFNREGLMRHYRDVRALEEALSEEFRAAGHRVVERDGIWFAIVMRPRDGEHESNGVLVNITLIAEALERRLS